MKITGVVLAGGRGVRLQGADKGLALWRGRPLIEWVIERLGAQVDELIINANRNADRYAAYGYSVVGDGRAHFAGPLAGIEAAMACARHPWILCAPCDTPALPADLRGRLAEAARARAVPVAIAQSPEGLQPTVALIHTDLLDNLRGFLDSGQRRARDWLLQQAHVAVLFPQAEAFSNLNTPDQLQAD